MVTCGGGTLRYSTRRASHCVDRVLSPCCSLMVEPRNVQPRVAVTLPSRSPRNDSKRRISSLVLSAVGGNPAASLQEVHSFLHQPSLGLEATGRASMLVASGVGETVRLGARHLSQALTTAFARRGLGSRRGIMGVPPWGG